MPEWMLRQEVADYARVSLSTVKRAMASGALPVSRIGRRVVIHRADAASWVAGRNLAATTLALVILAAAVVCASSQAGVEASRDIMLWLRCPFM